MKGETSETFRSHYLAHSSIPRLSQLLQQLIGYHTSIHSDQVAKHCQVCILCNPMGRFLEIMTKSTYQGSHACLNSCQWHQWEPHWLWKGQVCNWIFLASFHGEWMSVSQSKATLFKYSRPHEEVSNENTTTGWKHDPDVSSGLQ